MFRRLPTLLHLFNTAKPAPRTIKTGLFADHPSSQQPPSTPQSSAPNPQVSDRARKLIDSINQTNKMFLGIKINTNYLKVHKTMTITEIEAEKAIEASVRDLPFEISSSPVEKIGDSVNQEEVMTKKGASILFARNRFAPMMEKVRKLAESFPVDFVEDKPLSYLEPNFQRHCIRIRKALKGKVDFKLEENTEPIKVELQGVTLLKGVSVYRNDNYSVDSYSRQNSEEGEGIIDYKLFRQQKEQYPEEEWFATKKVTARLVFAVSGGPAVQVRQGEKALGSTKDVPHKLVFQTQLELPPLNSQHQLTAQQFLKSYRLRVDSLLLTNSDHKNPYYAISFSQEQKTSILLNRIILDRAK